MTGIERECRNIALQLVKEQYQDIDEIWKRRVNYDSVVRDYDAATIKEINRRMPNLLVKKGGVPLDELADEYGFSCCCDLVDVFLNYTNKAVAFDNYYNKLFTEFQDGASDVPF